MTARQYDIFPIHFTHTHREYVWQASDYISNPAILYADFVIGTEWRHMHAKYYSNSLLGNPIKVKNFLRLVR